MSGAETARCRVVQRRIGGAESAAPKRRRRNGPPPSLTAYISDSIKNTERNFESTMIHVLQLSYQNFVNISLMAWKPYVFFYFVHFQHFFIITPE